MPASTTLPDCCQLSCTQVPSETRNKGAACFQWDPKNHQMTEIFSHLEQLPGNVDKLPGKTVLEELTLQMDKVK